MRVAEVDFLVKVRDATAMLKDACEERLEKLAPPGCERAQGGQWDPAKIKWMQTEGSNGRYEKSEDVNSSDFKAMLKDLAEHQGKLSRDGLFYWKFDGKDIVGRKKRK
jgi:hypothetical protein